MNAPYQVADDFTIASTTNLLTSGVAQGVTTMPTGVAAFGQNELQVSFGLQSDFTAIGGTNYWLGLQFADNGATAFFETVNDNGTPFVEQSTNGFVSASGGVSQVAFSLQGIAEAPEPASWAMMIGGFGFIGGAVRRRRGGALAAA